MKQGLRGPPRGAVSQTLERERENCRRNGKSLPEKEARGLLGRGKCGTKALKLGRVWSPGEAGRRSVTQKQGVKCRCRRLGEGLRWEGQVLPGEEEPAGQ